MGRIIFVTGTDTGVGKTVVTALLLCHLRRRGINALAIKPFGTGDRNDAHLLEHLQNRQLTSDEVNPFFFPEPAAPLVAARHDGRAVTLSDALLRIRSTAQRCERLIVEGAGGIMTPLGERFCATALIGRLRCAVVVVAANRLGTINQALLAMTALGSLRLRDVKIILNHAQCGDHSALSNVSIVREWFPDIEVIEIPFLDADPRTVTGVKRNEKNLKKLLARISTSANVTPVLSKRGSERAGKKAVDSH